jgi:acyl-homoserine lactone acylase PvdQ
LQAIYDLADLENSQFMLSTGESGHFRSPYYDNFLAPFAAGERFTIPTGKDGFDPLARLQLSPAE